MRNPSSENKTTRVELRVRALTEMRLNLKPGTYKTSLKIKQSLIITSPEKETGKLVWLGKVTMELCNGFNVVNRERLAHMFRDAPESINHIGVKGLTRVIPWSSHIPTETAPEDASLVEGDEEELRRRTDSFARSWLY